MHSHLLSTFFIWIELRVLKVLPAVRPRDREPRFLPIKLEMILSSFAFDRAFRSTQDSNLIAAILASIGNELFEIRVNTYYM